MEKKQICFVQACWHKEIVDVLKDSFVEVVNRELPQKPGISFWEVPGSLEIPLQVQLCSKKGNYDIIVTAGLIVDGGVYRHEFVASSVLRSIMQIQLATEIPIIYAVLTPHHFHGQEHEEFFSEHFKVKGEEAAHACVQTLNNMDALQQRFAAS